MFLILLWNDFFFAGNKWIWINCLIPRQTLNSLKKSFKTYPGRQSSCIFLAFPKMRYDQEVLPTTFLIFNFSFLCFFLSLNIYVDIVLNFQHKGGMMMLQFIFILFDFFFLAYATLRCLRLVLIEDKKMRGIFGKSELFLLQIFIWIKSLSSCLYSTAISSHSIGIIISLSSNLQPLSSKRNILSLKISILSNNSNKILWITKWDHVAHAEDFCVK
jgi:hypothetical protein